MADPTLDLIEALQRQQREAMEQQQRLLLQAIKDWGDVVRAASAATTTPPPTIAMPNQPDVIAACARFGEQMMASHQEFIGALLKAHQPAAA